MSIGCARAYMQNHLQLLIRVCFVLVCFSAWRQKLAMMSPKWRRRRIRRRRKRSGTVNDWSWSRKTISFCFESKHLFNLFLFSLLHSHYINKDTDNFYFSFNLQTKTLSKLSNRWILNEWRLDSDIIYFFS